MRLIPVRLWVWTIVSGVLQVLPFPIAGPLPEWRAAFCWVALVPLLYVFASEDAEGRPLTVWQGARLGYVCGIVWYMGDCYWIYRTMNLYGGLPGPVSFGILILFSLYLGLYHALFGALVVSFRRSRLGVFRALVLAPFCWVAVELARARVTNFPWDLLGYSQVNNLLLTQLAPIGGVMSISFVIAAINCLLVCRFLGKTPARWKLVAAGVSLALLFELGAAAMNGLVGASTADRQAVLVQENLEVGAVGHEQAPLSTEQMYREFGRLSLHPEMGSERPALVVWPEAPAGFFTSNLRFLQAMSELARKSGAAMVVGSLGVDRDATVARGYKLYDSAAMFTPDGSYAGRYDKIHLVPWGEYVPFKEFFFFAGKLTAGVGDMDRGWRRDLFRADGHEIGVFICYESIFGNEVRQFVKNGAEVLVNISDDGWYGDTGAPWQHLNMARMRAIENARWVVRDTNTGVTTTIDPYGRLSEVAPRHVRGAYEMPYDYRSGITIYTRFGDWFAWLCAGLVAVGLAFNSRFALRTTSRKTTS